MLFVRKLTVKLDDKLRRRMASVSINWPGYIREAITERIEREERKRVARDLLAELA